MPIYDRNTKRKGLVYDVVVRAGDATVWRRGFPTKAGARRAEATILNDVRNGYGVPDPTVTIAAYMETWLATKAASMTASSSASYRRQCKPIVDALGRTKLAELKPGGVQRFVAELRGRGLGQTTIWIVVGRLREMLRQAMLEEIIIRNPTASIRISAPRPRVAQILDEKDTVRLFAAAESESCVALVFLAISTGMRRSELLNLHWHDVDFAGGVLRVRKAKSRSGIRAIALDTETLDVLRAHRLAEMRKERELGRAWPATGLVFTSPIGLAISESTLYFRWDRIRKAAGLPDVHFHDLRHQQGALLARLGVHPKVAQERLGHANFNLTMATYTAVGAEQQRAAADAVGGVLGRALAQAVSKTLAKPAASG